MVVCLCPDPSLGHGIYFLNHWTEWMEGQTEVGGDGWMGKWVDGFRDRGKDERMGGWWMVGWMDG